MADKNLIHFRVPDDVLEYLEEREAKTGISKHQILKALAVEKVREAVGKP